jgi:hypothetical protein
VPSYQITDAQIHALVGDGTHGRRERIQTLRCQACHTTFSTRYHTPLERLKTASVRVAEVLTALAEGLCVAAAVRAFGHRHATITTFLSRAGDHSATLHDRFFRNLHLPHIQLDELRTRVRSHAQALWLWVAIDPVSKIVPVLYLGARTQQAADRGVHNLHHRLASGCLPVLISDGLNHSFYALTAGTLVAGGRRPDLWAGQEALSPRAPGAGDASDALWDARGTPGCTDWARTERPAKHRLCGARQEGRCGKVSRH